MASTGLKLGPHPVSHTEQELDCVRGCPSRSRVRSGSQRLTPRAGLGSFSRDLNVKSNTHLRPLLPVCPRQYFLNWFQPMPPFKSTYVLTSFLPRMHFTAGIPTRAAAKTNGSLRLLGCPWHVCMCGCVCARVCVCVAHVYLCVVPLCVSPCVCVSVCMSMCLCVYMHIYV